MYKLYYSPGACSMAIHVILNELGQKVELINTSLSEGKNRDSEFLKVNPRGQVPVLVDDGLVIREGAAQMIYLMEKHQSPMLPKSGAAHAAALEWLMYGNASMHPAYGKMFFIMKNTKDEAAKQQLFETCLEQINKMWKDVDDRLAKSKYVAGDQITAADILLTVIANWAGHLPKAPTLGSNVKRLLKEVSSRPAYQAALKSEQVEYKAAA